MRRLGLVLVLAVCGCRGGSQGEKVVAEEQASAPDAAVQTELVAVEQVGTTGDAAETSGSGTGTTGVPEAATSDTGAGDSSTETGDGTGAADEPAALSDEDFLYVSQKDGDFPSVGSEQPRLILYFDHEREIKFPDELGEAFMEEGELRRLDAATAAKLKLTPPGQVWLFGESGPCKAKLGSAYAYPYTDGMPAIEVGYLLEPCADKFAPLAYVGAEAPKAQWESAGLDVSEELGKDWKKWAHPKREAFAALGAFDWTPDEDEKRRPRLHLRSLEAGAAGEVAYAWHWPGDACEESESIGRAVGLWSGGKFSALPDLSEYSGAGELMGALMLGELTLVIVVKDRFQLYFSRWRGPGDGDYGAWVERRTGEYHDEEVAYAGWSVLESYCGP